MIDDAVDLQRSGLQGYRSDEFRVQIDDRMLLSRNKRRHQCASHDGIEQRRQYAAVYRGQQVDMFLIRLITQLGFAVRNLLYPVTEQSCHAKTFVSVLLKVAHTFEASQMREIRIVISSQTNEPRLSCRDTVR